LRTQQWISGSIKSRGFLGLAEELLTSQIVPNSMQLLEWPYLKDLYNIQHHSIKHKEVALKFSTQQYPNETLKKLNKKLIIYPHTAVQ
jgi:hypothetical protein